ncbi:MAG: sulfatase-like hydrolase/transferase, partial [Myxococcota bacterium]
AVADTAVATGGSGPQATAWDWIRAGLHLVALELPLGVVAGVAAGLALVALRAAPWAAPLRRHFDSRRALLAHAPEAFATGVGLLLATAGFLLTVRATAEHFATRYHDAHLAAWAMAATTLALLAAALLVAVLVAAVVRPVARRMGRAASSGSVLLLGVLGVATVVATVAIRSPDLLRAYDPLTVAWFPLAAVVYVATAFVARRVWRDRGRPARAPRITAAVVLAVAAGAIGWSSQTYGRSHVVRSLVEQQTVLGLRLVRAYMRATDRDGDGHAFAFGGGDCDDTDPNVYPGALDVPGDGVDADCFAGDGSPEVAAFGEGGYGSLPEGLDRPNILLVTIDALRADHLGSYGYDRATSPHMDAFAERATRFTSVTAQSSRSIRSLPATLTGFYPSQIAYGDEYLFPSLQPENVTVAEALRDGGYRTAVTMGTDYFERVAGFFQGFENVDQSDRYRPPRRAPMTRALRQLDELQQQDDPWFLWAHLFNVHEEYLWDRTPSEFGDELVDAYDTEIKLADREVGRLLDEVRRRGLMDETVVIVTADHGEAFGEHGAYGHSTALYEEQLQVPLLMHVPGLEPGIVDDPVALFDLMPTALNLASVPVPKQMPARSLVPLATGEHEAPADRLILSELLPDGLYPYDQKAIRRGDSKLIWWVREGSFQLYDLRQDPEETTNLADDRRAEAEELLGLLRAWVAQTNRPEQRHRQVVKQNRLESPPAHMTRRLGVRYPGFTLLGFDLPNDTFRPGDRIDMTFYYRVDSLVDDNLFFMVDIKGPSGYSVPAHFHAHHFPMNGRYRTYEWQAGEILRDPVEMIVPEDIRHPVTLSIDLTVFDARRQVVPFRTKSGAEKAVVDLAEVEIR